MSFQPWMKPYLPLFRKECTDRAKRIDPSNEQDWKSLTVGWGIAKGLSPLKAQYLAVYIRYETDLA